MCKLNLNIDCKFAAVINNPSQKKTRMGFLSLLLNVLTRWLVPVFATIPFYKPKGWQRFAGWKMKIIQLCHEKVLTREDKVYPLLVLAEKIVAIKIPKAKFLLSRLRLWNPRPLSMVSIYNRHFPYFSVLKISLLIFMLFNNNYAGTPVFVSTLSWSWTRHPKCFHEEANGTW